MTVREWLVLNWKVGALSFGGGGRAIYYQDALVDQTSEITADEFNEGATITQLIPGPNLVNLAMYLGVRIVGIYWMFVGFLLLCVPGAVLGVLLYNVIDLNNPTIALLFKGFSLGSVTFFVIFVYRLSLGLRTDIGRNVNSKKLALRIFFASSIAVCSLSGLSLLWVLPVAIPLAIICEFQTWL